MKQRLIKSLIYGGVSPDIYRMIEPDVIKSNLSSLQLFSPIMMFAMLLLVGASFVAPSLDKNRMVYLVMCGCGAVSTFLSLVPCRERPKLVKPTMYLFLASILWFGVELCTVIEPNEVAVSLVVLLFALPLLFTDRPINMIMLLIAGILMYVGIEEYALRLEGFTERALQVRGYNFTNIMPYSAISAVVSTYLMRIKMERFAYILKNKMLSETDQMTGLLNRRSYSILLERLREEKPSASMTVCSIDLNGLKIANDTYGHSAGDEMICGAAQCIEDVLGAYGTCYRTGGDEFVALIEGKSPGCDELREKLYKCCASWRGKVIGPISISAGIVQNTDLLPIDDLIARSDAAMYAEKAKYYAESGMKRR